MAHRQLQAAETATTNSPIASRTRKRGVVSTTANINDMDAQTTVAASAASRVARPKSTAPVAQAAAMVTPEATAQTPGPGPAVAATPGTFRPTFARRFVPRDENDTRSVRSLPSAHPDQSQLDDYEMTPSQYHAGTPSIMDRDASMAPSDAFHTPGGGNGQVGVARALEKNLPKLMEAANELHQLLSDPERNPQESQEGNTIWLGEVTVAHTILAGIKRPYCAQGAAYIRDTEDLCERLQYTYGDVPFETAKIVASVVNLTELMHDLTFLRDDLDEYRVFVGKLDKHFPASFAPMPLLRRGDWEMATLALAVDIRTQVVISKLRELESGQSATETLADVFLEYIDKQRHLGEQLDVSHSFRGLPGCDAVQYRFKELASISKAPEHFWQRCQELRELIGEHDDNIPEVITLIEDHFDFPGFRSVLQSWTGGVITEIGETPINEGPFDPNMGTPASARLRASLNGRSQYSPIPSGASASADAVQAFIRLGVAGQHLASPTPADNSSPGTSRGQKRPRNNDDDDEDQDFEQDQRIPDNQSMPPPPRPTPRRRRRAKRVQTEPHIPVDPVLTGVDSSQYPAPPDSVVGGDVDSSRPIAGSDAGTDPFASPAPPPSISNIAAAPNLVQMSQHAKAMSALARQRNPKPPQTRVPWSVSDCQRLILAVGAYDAKWSKIAEAIRNGQVPLEHPRDQQALRDKARLLKQDMLKTDSILPPGFDLVLFGRKEVEAVKLVGKNPNRKESDIDPATGRSINTEWIDPNAPAPLLLEEHDEEQQDQQQEQLTAAEEAAAADALVEQHENEQVHGQRQEEEEHQQQHLAESHHQEQQQGHLDEQEQHHLDQPQQHQE